MGYKIINGDCVEVMKLLEENSIDAICTDPPYELNFMQSKWDGTGIAYSVPMWTEALRVLKPGGHLLSFGGSRTYHRMACAIEDAGFEIRDQIQWIYGSGFPKSLDVSKAIDKTSGRAENWFGPWLRAERERIGMTATHLAELGDFYKNVNHGGLVVNWELGYGLPSAKEFNKVCELLNAPFEQLEELEREVVGSRKVHKGLAFTSNGEDYLDITIPATDAAKQWEGWGTALKPAHEPIVLARKPLIGTVVSNVLQYGTGALNIDACRIPGEPVPINKLEAWSGFGEEKQPDYVATVNDKGRWPANLLHDGSDEVMAEFAKYGESKGTANGGSSERNSTLSEDYWGEGGGGFKMGRSTVAHGDSGSPARFFYCAKTSAEDRNEGCEHLDAKTAGEATGGRKEGSDGLNSPRAGAGRTSGAHNHHPTVKPTELMQYLCKMITPPGGTVLDCFMGSGSTGKAALMEGFNFIGIEQDAEYCAIAKARMEHVLETHLPLFRGME